MRGGALPGSLGENNINQLRQIDVGENNLAAIAQLEMPKPPLQPLGQVVNVSAYPVTGSVPFIDRVRGALKRTKVISRGARAIGATRIANFAEMHGYGRMRRGRMTGRGPAFVDRYGEFIHAY